MLLRLSCILLLCAIQINAQQKQGLNELFMSVKENDSKIISLGLQRESLILQAKVESGMEPLELEFEAPNLGQDEFSIMLSQEFVLGGVKTSKSNSLKKEASLIDLEILKRENELFQIAGVLFVDLTVLQKRSSKIADLFSILNETVIKLDSLVKLGAASKFEIKRLNLEKKSLEYSQLKIEKEIELKVKQIGELAGVQLTSDHLRQLELGKFLSFEIDEVSFFEVQNTEQEKRLEIEKEKLNELDIPFVSNMSVGLGMTQNRVESKTTPDLAIGISLPLFTNKSEGYQSQEKLVESFSRSYEASNKMNSIGLKAKLLEVENLKVEIKILKDELIPGYASVLKQIADYENVDGFSFVEFQMAKGELIALENNENELYKGLGLAYLDLITFSGEIKNVFK